MNNTNFDFAEEVPVNWPGASGEKKKGAQIYTAKVIRF
jgi:hypothetical protein